MWLYTKFGFFSVIADANAKGRLVIRARRKEDLLNLRTRYLPSLSKTVTTERSDYRYRAFVTKADFKRVIPRIVEDITYSNFKDSVEDQDRHGIYLDVWFATQQLQDPSHGPRNWNPAIPPR